jgi:two-component system, OmpR family, phosphate regulon sensor histidine kinase PhoR
MFSFRQKILISYAVVFLLFIGLIYPFSTRTVHKIARKAMEDRASELIADIQSTPNNEALIKRLKEEKALLFFRVSVITDERKVLYDSHTKRLLGPRFSQEFIVSHPEVLEAFREGIGYHEDYSDLLGQKLSYMAVAFDFHGKTYVLRTAFPFRYVSEITGDFEIGFLVSSTAILLLFSTMSWFLINYLTSPIQQIIRAIRPYQEGLTMTVPEIHLRSMGTRDEIGQLAETLNSLSIKIKKHIETLTQERNEKEAVLESLVEGVVAVDREMVVQYANQKALKLLGFEREKLIDQSFSVTEQHKCYTLLSSCQRDSQVKNDTLQIKREGQKLFLDIVAAPTKDGTGAILVLQDKTADYKLLEMRKDFIANASHELKTPITIIRGFAEMLHDNPDLPKSTFSELTSKIVRNCKRMTNLIKDLLTLTDVENIPDIRLRDCNLYELIQGCTRTVLEVFPDAQISIKKPENEETYLIADPHLMELAFLNLIENAAKYSTPPAEIHIDIHFKNSHCIELIIADKGIGIPQADLEFIFQRFYTVNKAHSQKLGGSGLGLSIVETIIEKHFGKISVASEVGKGTTFTILLPVDLKKSPLN